MPSKAARPDHAGVYQLRYQSDRVEGVAARRPIEVVPSAIALEAPQEIPAGQPFEVSWIGPDGDRDYITVVERTAPDGTYASYRYTRDGSPARLHAPITPGEYELRYQSDREDGVFARRPITVTPANIVLDAPAEVAAGKCFDVQWQGPNGDRDYITIVKTGSPPGAYLDYRYTSEGSPVKLEAPDEPGSYEVRYQSDRVKNKIFGSRPIRVQ